MKKLSLITALGLAGMIGLGAIAQDLSRNSQEPTAQEAAVGNPDLADPQGNDGSKTMLLTIGVDARGVHVMQGTAKPNLEYRSHRRWQDQPFRFLIRDAQGTELAQGGSDPAPMCLDPSHYGQDPHVPGDYMLPHETHTNIRIPDFGSRMSSIEFQVRENGAWRQHGAATSTNAFGVYR